MNEVDHYWLLNPEEQEQEQTMKQVLLREAQRCGPAVARVVGNIWSSSLKEADHDARKLIRLSTHYTPERVEAACKRAIYYRQDKNSYIISWLLEKNYDRLSLSPYTDIKGQFVFSFEPLIQENQNNVESCLMWENLAD